MSETKESNDKTLSVAPRKPLSLKRTVESGHVKQSFSHGRSKSVVVEKKKKRTISAPGEDGQDAESGRKGAGGLSSGEMDARRRALESARERAEAEAREAVEREAQRAREEAERKVAEPPPVEAPPVAAETHAEAAAPAAETPAPEPAVPAAQPAEVARP